MQSVGFVHSPFPPLPLPSRFPSPLLLPVSHSSLPLPLSPPPVPFPLFSTPSPFSSVRSQSLRYPKAGHPMGNKSFCARRRGGLNKRNGFHPTGCAVNDCEKMGEPIAWWQWAHDVNMNVGKTSLRNGNFLRLETDVAVDL
jgi:hypothetical protein